MEQKKQKSQVIETLLEKATRVSLLLGNFQDDFSVFTAGALGEISLNLLGEAKPGVPFSGNLGQLFEILDTMEAKLQQLNANLSRF